MALLSLKINGKPHRVDVDHECPLPHVLRDHIGLNNPRLPSGLPHSAAPSA
jgi:aerobic-type carbon monoxide dehydrogenase small subunit (CoxS/CutS family)